jgi:hypothetical protein
MTSLTKEILNPEEETIPIDYQSISRIKDIFINQTRDVWIALCTNFINQGPGLSAQELINFMNSRHLESTYEYEGIDFDDFQRAIPAILRNLNKIDRISNIYDWHYVCKNLNKCAYLCFIWTLWPYRIRNDKIKQIYLSARNGNTYSQNIFNLPDTCTWKDWATVMDYKESWSGMESQVHATFTDISKIIQYPKTLSDIEKAYAQQVIQSKINGMFTCQQIHTITCYAYNNKLVGRLHADEGSLLSGYYRSTKVYAHDDKISWFDPPKPSDKKKLLTGWFEFNNPQNH